MAYELFAPDARGVFTRAILTARDEKRLVTVDDIRREMQPDVLAEASRRYAAGKNCLDIHAVMKVDGREVARRSRE